MLSPVVHIEFPLNLLGGILQKVGATMMPVGKSLIRNMDTETSIYDGKGRYIQTKAIHVKDASAENYDVVNVVVYVSLNIEECIKHFLFNHYKLLY